MEQSTNYNFNLPSKNDETSADIDLISDNFRTVDDIVKQVQDDVSKIPTNLVNGSAAGSLRSVDAQEEDENYKMGDFAVALGVSAMAIGESSFAEGVATRAEGYSSHAEGMFTVAKRNNQHVQGVANIVDEEGRYAHIVGNGNPDVYNSNAHTLDWDGNAWFAGDVYVGGTSQDDESATKLSGVATDVAEVKEKLKNHTAFSILVSDPNSKTYIKLGKFTGDGIGGRAIFTINGKVGWNNKNDGGLKILTLSSNDSRDTTSTDIFTGGSFFDFGHSNNDGTSIIEDTPDIQVAIVRPSEYTVKEVDIYLKFTPTKYTSYLVTVDYSDTCKWETDVKPVNATDPDPMETALSSYIVPKKRFGGVEEGATKTIVDTALSTTSTNPIQNKVIVENLDKKVNLTNGTIQGAVDWNTITTTGCYKIQNCTMTSDYNAPLNEYVYGVLQVLNSENETGEHRVTQIYMPRSPQRYSLWIRTNNSTTGYNNWSDWVPFNNAFQLYTKFSTKADIESGTCTLSASNGTVSNATYSVVGNMVTLNFNIAPTGAGNVVVSGLPFTATKNQSGFASSTATYNITANQTSVSINSTSGTAEYCTVTYLK